MANILKILFLFKISCIAGEMEGMRQETERLHVTIRIQDLNDNHPIFSKSKFFVELLEESPRDHSAYSIFLEFV